MADSERLEFRDLTTFCANRFAYIDFAKETDGMMDKNVLVEVVCTDLVEYLPSQASDT